jgi:hypothetical protein
VKELIWKETETNETFKKQHRLSRRVRKIKMQGQCSTTNLARDAALKTR